MEDLTKKMMKLLGDEKEELLRRLEYVDGNIEKLKVKLNDLKKRKCEEEGKPEETNRKEGIEEDESEEKERKVDEKEECVGKKRKRNDDDKEEPGPSTSRTVSVDKKRSPLGEKFYQPFIFIADLTNEFLDKEEYLNDAHSILQELFNSPEDVDTSERKMGSLFAYNQNVVPGLHKFLKDTRALSKSREEFQAYLGLEEKVRKTYGKYSDEFRLIKRLLNINRGNYLGTLTRDETLDKLFGKEEALKTAAKEYLLRFHGSALPLPKE